MILTDLLSLALRIGELAFTSVVAGLTGQYLHDHKGASAWDEKRFIYTEVIAAIGILFSLLFLLPFMTSFFHWPMDLILFALFMISFGLLAHYDNTCGSIWNWSGITQGGFCNKFKANLAFVFLASIFFLASALIGIWVTHRRTGRDTTTTSRRRWGRTSRV